MTLLRKKLEFLYKHGRAEQVGMYLRNRNLDDPDFDEVYAKRTDCERTHNHIGLTHIPLKKN